MYSLGTRNVAKRTLSLGLVLALMAPQSGGLLSGAHGQSALPLSTPNILVKSILVFPTANNVTAAPAAGATDAGAAATTGDTGELGAKMDSSLKFRFDTIGRLKLTYFTVHLAAVQRALDDKVLTSDDLTPPIGDVTKAGKIAKEVETDAYLVTNIESLDYDKDAKKATLVVSADLYKTDTGEHLKGLALTGKGVAAIASDGQESVTQYAINDASSQIVSALNGDVRTTPITVTKSQIGHSDTSRNVLLALLGGALLFAVFHHGGNSSSGSNTTGGSTTGGGTTGGGTTGGTTNGGGTTSGTTSGPPPPPPL